MSTRKIKWSTKADDHDWTVRPLLTRFQTCSWSFDTCKTENELLKAAVNIIHDINHNSMWIAFTYLEKKKRDSWKAGLQIYTFMLCTTFNITCIYACICQFYTVFPRSKLYLSTTISFIKSISTYLNFVLNVQ